MEQEGLLHKIEFTCILELSCCMVEHKHPGRKGISSMAHKDLPRWPRTHLQVSEVKCCPWIIQKQTCRILNFPNLHQLPELIGNVSMLYFLCMFLLGVWGTFRLIKYFNQQNWWLHLKRVLSPAHSLVPALKFASYKWRTVYGAKPLEKILFSLFCWRMGERVARKSDTTS